MMILPEEKATTEVVVGGISKEGGVEIMVVEVAEESHQLFSASVVARKDMKLLLVGFHECLYE